MEVYFVDVGQGTSNVILLGKRRAIVIDTGKRSADLSRLLNHLQVAELTVLALSHLDDDHSGGAPGIMTEFRGRIGKICYPNDHRTPDTRFWEALQDEIDSKDIEHDQLVRLEYEDRPKGIWRSAALGAELKLFSPSYGENQMALRREDPNATSGVLVFKMGNRRIVFPGDSTLEQWQEIHRRMGQSLPCDIIAVPHHAGVIWPNGWANTRIQSELQWLYSVAVQPKHAVISVGTSNTDRHPRPEVLGILRGLGVKILCTQITEQCSTPLERHRPGILPLILPGRSQSITALTTSGNSRDLACAGTIVADISSAAVGIRRIALHQQSVNAIQGMTGGSPLCR